MERHKRVIPALASLLLVFSATALACPWCDFSPSNFGFCKYYNPSGPYDCKTVVRDEWSGQTACSVCGSCSWSNPETNRPCVAADQDEYVRYQMGSAAGACSEIRISDNNLSWVGARVDQVAIF